MNILFVASSNNPFVATQGSSQRSCLLLNACEAIADVDVVSFCTDNAESFGKSSILYQDIIFGNKPEGRIKKFFHLCTPWRIESLYQIDRRKEIIIDNILHNGNYDFIVTRYVPQAVSCGLMKYADKLVIDIDDSPVERALIEAKAARSIRNKLYLILFAMVNRIGLKRVISSSYNVFFSNVEEAKKWHKPFLPNIPFYDVINLRYSQGEIAGRLLFIGDLGYSVNQQGISYFLSSIYPLIKQVHPEITFHIVGRLWDNSLKEYWESYPGVSVTGFVQNLCDEYEKSQLVVIPIYQGAGTCIKVLEAMQMKKPIVTTEVGFRGYSIFFNDNEDCLVAKNDKMFVQYVLMLLESEQKRIQISTSAYAKQQASFTKEIFNKTVKEVLI